MKTQNLLLILASACVMVLLSSGSAYAQENQIIAEYLVEYDENSTDTLGELRDVARDLSQCFDRFEDCSDRFGSDQSLAECLSDFIPCASREGRDKLRTCSRFLREFRGDYSRALRDARRAGVAREFETSEAVLATVVAAEGIASLCY
jgi:hypothetical protein